MEGAERALVAVLDRYGSVAAFAGSGAFALIAAVALLALVPGRLATAGPPPGRTAT